MGEPETAEGQSRISNHRHKHRHSYALLTLTAVIKNEIGSHLDQYGANIIVSVTDAQGFHVPGLEKEDFTLTEFRKEKNHATHVG